MNEDEIKHLNEIGYNIRGSDSVWEGLMSLCLQQAEKIDGLTKRLEHCEHMLQKQETLWKLNRSDDRIFWSILLAAMFATLSAAVVLLD